MNLIETFLGLWLAPQRIKILEGQMAATRQELQTALDALDAKIAELQAAMVSRGDFTAEVGSVTNAINALDAIINPPVG